jgi:two-component system, NarL family, response regulator LiaR
MAAKVQISFPDLEVGIVEDELYTLQGLEARLMALGCQIVWKAGDAEEAKVAAAEHLPQVVFVDLSLRVPDNGRDYRPGWELIKHLDKQKQGKLFASIIYTGTPMDDAIVLEAIRMGCSYIIKQDVWDKDTEMLASALLAAMSNSVFLSHEVAKKLETIVDRSQTPNLLSEREWEILELVAGGLSNGEIAKRTFIEVSTVKTHVSSILSKLNVDNRGKAADWYRQNLP